MPSSDINMLAMGRTISIDTSSSWKEWIWIFGFLEIYPFMIKVKP